MRIAAIGLDVSLDAPYDERVARAAGLVQDQRSADLVVLPELWAHGAFAYDTWAESAESVNGPAVSAMSSAARVVVPASWPDKRVEHWRLLARARAVESRAYLIACNAVGSHAGCSFLVSLVGTCSRCWPYV